jgi:hypothetical protein
LRGSCGGRYSPTTECPCSSWKPSSDALVPQRPLAGYLDQSLGNPEELVIEAKGRRRKHVHAYWDGCAYVV